MACEDTIVCLGPFLRFLHRFRWVHCQLDVLRQCSPSSVRVVLAGLPESLDETYERILQQIPKPDQVHAHRLLQCLVVAARPLSVEELAEVLVIDFSGTGMASMIDENVRWEDKERAVLSACSSLITIVKDWGSRRVQFSHSSVKEFLTSDRLAASTVDTLRYHHVQLEAAHIMMAQVCLSVTFQLDNHMDKRIRSYPLSSYAGKYLVNHVEFENVISSIRVGVDKLLDRDKPHFYTWVWLQIGDRDPRDPHTSEMDRSVMGPHYSLRTPYHDDTEPRHPPRLPPLYYVSALGHLCLARHLISKCSQDLYVRDNEGCTPLHIAVLARKEGVLQPLIEHSVDLNIQDINDRTPLHMAAYMGLVKATRMLLERGEPLKAHLNAKDDNGHTPLHLASRRGHFDVARLLLEFGADADVQDNDTMTPLLLVSTYRLGTNSRITKSAQVLLEHGASVHMRNKNGQTPLHVALHHGLSDIMALLLNFGADVDALVNGATPLLLVSQSQLPIHGDDSKIVKTAQVLLEHGASVHVRNHNGLVPLHAALHNGLFGMIAFLLKFGADVDAQDNDSMTPLLLVSQSRRPMYGDDSQITKVAQVLLEHGASVHVRTKSGQMPLHLALHHDFLGIVALLLKFGADVDAYDNDALTPLLSVLQSCRGNDSKITKTAQLLLEHGASVQVRNKSGQMPLHLASSHDFLGIAALLLKFGADVDAHDNDATTPLLSVLQSCRGNDSKIPKTAQLLLENGASVRVRNKSGQMPLHLASSHDLFGIVTSLLKLGADVDARDNDAMTPLLLALQSCRGTKTVQVLLEHGANVRVRNKSGQVPLHLALRHGVFGIVTSLLKFGADVDVHDNDAMTPLLLALQYRSGDDSKFTETVQVLLEHGASVHVWNKSSQTPLHLALHHECFGIVALLPKFGADINAQDNDIMTPLHLVSQYRLGDDSRSAKTAQLLLEHGASVHIRNKNGQTPLHLALHHGCFSIVALLLKFGADADACDNDAMTPLLLVLQSHWGDDSKITKTAQVLVDHGANAHVQNKSGQVPLHLASHHGLFCVVTLLLKLGADVDAQDNDDMTPLLLTLQSCQSNDSKITKIAQLLLEHGANVHVRNKSGQMPLHIALNRDFFGIVALLLRSGVDINAQDNDTMTPLLLVLQYHWGDDSRSTKTAQLLLEHGASVHMHSKNGRTPLHLASQHVLSGTVEILLRFGADVDTQDNSSNTPLHFAVSSPFQCKFTKSFLDNSPLLWSVIKTIKLLLENGANIQIQNVNGETPFQVGLMRGEQEIIDMLYQGKPTLIISTG